MLKSSELHPGQLITWGNHPPQLLLVISTEPSGSAKTVMLCDGRRRSRLLKLPLGLWHTGSLFRACCDLRNCAGVQSCNDEL
jgi:hypothetical protein